MNEKIVVAIVVKESSVLLIKRKVPEGDLVWTFPSGRIERGETEKEAVVREVREETNVSCLPTTRIGERKHPGTKKDLMYWLCKYEQGQIKITDDEDIAELMWATPDAVFKKITSDIFQPVKAMVLKIKNNNAHE